MSIPITEETRERISLAQCPVHATAGELATGKLMADLYYAATIGGSLEAQEQLRLLDSVNRLPVISLWCGTSEPSCSDILAYWFGPIDGSDNTSTGSRRDAGFGEGGAL